MSQVSHLSAKIDTEIVPAAPFSFEGTMHKPSHFPTPDNHYDHAYWQTMQFNGRVYGLKFANVGGVDNPCIALSIYYNPADESHLDLSSITKEIEYRFDLRADIASFNNRFASDSLLGPVIERWNGTRVSTPYSLYEFMVVTTVLQNTVVRRTVQMMENLFRHYGTLAQFDEKDLYAFWMPGRIDAVDEAELRSLKVGYRAKNLKRQAANFASGIVDEHAWRTLDKEALKNKLLALYGIGPATVQYILFEVFHHYDALEYIPPWEQKIYSRLLFERDLVDTSLLLTEIDRRFGKWKMLAMHYIFEDLFWKRKNDTIPWLEELIRL